MPLSHDVRLPKSHVPVFPSRCPNCGADPATVTVKLSGNQIGLPTFLSWLPRGSFNVHVPMCDPCAARCRRQGLVRLVASCVLVLAATVGASMLVSRYHGPFKKWIVVGTTLGLLLPLIGWEIFNPKAVDLTVFSGSVDYEFADADYAKKFAELNGGTVK